MMRHIREIEFPFKDCIYALEIDTEDQDNLVIESVTQISGPLIEFDIDPDMFSEALDIDDWQVIKESLK